MSGELAGRLRERIVIRRRSTARDAAGGAAGTWIDLGATSAALAADEGGETVAGEARMAAQRWRVTIRSGADVGIGDRLAWRGRQLRVRRRIDDPTAPDRIMLDVEEERE